MTPRFVARQLSRPTGLLGCAMGRLMNRRNAKMNTFAVQLLSLTPEDSVLEIGFGGGVNLPTLIHSVGFVTGVDRSADVVARAKSRFSAHIASGRADFCGGSVEALSFEASAFSKICTVNTVYFWSSLDLGAKEIYRVLSPGGRVAVGFLPKEWMDRMQLPPDIFTSRTTEDLVSAFSKASFLEMRVERPAPTIPWNVVIAVR